jgi:exodeoxyribonuclease V alpha subunit
VLKKDPYRLAADIHGVGFKTADEIAANMGIAKEAPQRVRAGLLYSLDEAAVPGPTSVPRPAMIAEAA